MLKTLDDSTLEIPSEDKYLLCIFFSFFPTVLLYPNIVNEKKNWGFCVRHSPEQT